MSKVRKGNDKTGKHEQEQHEETQNTKSTERKSTTPTQVVTRVNSGAPEE